MKKILTTVLALILVLSITATAFAVDSVNVKLTADKETIHAGEAVTISIDVDKAVSNLNDFQFNVYFDDELLEMTGSTKGSAYAATVVGDAKNGCIPVSGIDTLGDPVAFTAGNVATITFTAKTDITEEKTAAFEVVVDSLTDYDTFEQNPSTVSNTSVVIEIAAHEHEWDDGEVTTEPTCEDAGVKTFKCKVAGCKETTTEEIEKTGHSYDKGVVTTEPECEKAGVKTFICGACGDTYTEAVEKTGHSYDNGVVTKEPTEEEEGVKTFTCGTCGDTYTEPIDKLEGGETPPAGDDGEGDEGGTTPPAGGESTTPDTGDNSMMVVFIIAAVICLGGIAFLTIKKKQLSK